MPIWRGLIAAGALALATHAAAAQPGSAQRPISVHMKRGTDRVVLTGTLDRDVDCCTYRFAARAGQTLSWTETGAVTRVTLTYPDGHQDGPMPNTIPLPKSGTYLFRLAPNMMADGAFGPFSLTLSIPPG